MPVVEFNGRKLHYLDEGEGIAILWIHGYPLSARLFEPQLAIANARHIAPDLPGFGESDPPAGHATIETYARELLQLLDTLNIDSALVAGVSMGGYVAMTVARIAPQRVRGLILIDTREVADTQEGRKGRLRSIEIARKRGVGPIVDEMLPKMLTPATLAREDDRAIRTRAIMKSATREGVLTALQAMADRPDSTDVLRNLDVPVLIVVGSYDGVTPPPDAERMRSLVKNGTLVEIDDAAHLSNLEQPRQFNRAIESFLEAFR